MTKLERGVLFGKLAEDVADRAGASGADRNAVIEVAYVTIKNAVEQLVRRNAPKTPVTHTCAFCEHTSADPCGDDWIPSYRDRELGPDSDGLECDGPVCPDCIKSRLTYDPESEEYVLPPTTDFDLKLERGVLFGRLAEDTVKRCPYCQTPVFDVAEDVASRAHPNGISPTDIDADGCEFCNPVETCAFCERTSKHPHREAWEPYYWDEELNKELFSAVCPECAKTRLHYSDEHGDYYLPRNTFDPAIELPSDG